MADHDDVLTTDFEEFVRRIALIEAAFGNLHAAYCWDSDGGGHRLDVFDLGDEFKDGDEWLSVREFGTAIQPLLFFAFEDAPDSVVIRWGEDHVEGLGPAALQRVEHIRSAMPLALEEWKGRFNNLGNVFGDITTSTVYSPEVGGFRTIVHMSSFMTDGLRKVPLASSRQYLSAVLSRAEIRRLIDALEMADMMYPDSDIFAGDDDGATAEEVEP